MESEMTMNHQKVRPYPTLVFGPQGAYGGLAEALTTYYAFSHSGL